MVKAEVHYLSPALAPRPAEPLVYSKETRGAITAPVNISLADARIDPASQLPPREQLQLRGFAMVPDFLPACHAELHAVEGPAAYRQDGRAESRESAEIRQAYFRDIEDLVRKVTGAEVAFAVTHNVRTPQSHHLAKGAKRRDGDVNPGVDYIQSYAQFVHCDYSPGVLAKARRMLSTRGVEAVDELAFVNVWQPILHEVEMAPLALLDSRSVAHAEMETTILGYAITPSSSGKVRPSILQLRPSAAHKWFYYPRMQPSEALVFVQADSRPGHARHCFHTSVKHAVSDQPIPRHSIEVRVLCGFRRTETARL
eukprot:TRINITY_DN6687_c0_g1_i3.p1 TRINITY_DN6687_c0_g1~~TRINITY_DN6687_c0_g1_i3.p1  ORF type:complete len:312 (-),score=54.81 TRINITY_DN6687_c0_g1_i3:436-1371(-)